MTAPSRLFPPRMVRRVKRRVARLVTTGFAAQQAILSKTAADKLRSLPVSEWRAAFKKHWDPKRDFSFNVRETGTFSDS